MLQVNNRQIKIGDVVNTTMGRARLDYIGRQSFSNWTLIDQREKFCFGRPITVEDNDLNSFIL